MSITYSGTAFLFFLCFQTAVIVVILILLWKTSSLQKQRNALLQEKDVVFRFVHDISEVFVEADSVDLHALLNKVLSFALRTTGGKAGAIYMIEPDDETLRVGAVSGVFPPMTGDLGEGFETAFSKIRHVENLVRQQTLKLGKGLVGEVAATGMPVLIENAERNASVPRYEHEMLNIRSMLAAPMRFRGNPMGAVVIINQIDGKSFSADDVSLLKALADHASVSIHYARFSAALDEKRRLDYDLGVAKKIQTALLPKRIPEAQGIELAAFSLPAQQIGGDYYDFFPINGDHFGVVVADVSGKGVSGAIIMSICRSVLKIEASGCLSPASVLRKVNGILTPDLSEDMFISILYMILNTNTHELVVCRGGHTYPIISPRDAREPMIIKSGGIAMGLADAAAFDAALEEKHVRLKPGDMVVGYTDGLTEARDRNANEWGILNLLKTIQVTAFEGGTASDVASNVRQKLLQFVGDMPQYDDMTVVVMKTVG